MMQRLQGQDGASPPLVLATCALLVLLGLFLGLVEFLGATAVREQAQAALVTAVRAAARQIDRRAWVFEHRLVLLDPAPTFRRLVTTNLDLDPTGAPRRPGGLIDGRAEAEVSVSTGSTGLPRVSGRLTVPVRTLFLGHRVVLQLSYSADAEAAGW